MARIATMLLKIAKSQVAVRPQKTSQVAADDIELLVSFTERLTPEKY
jgi:hypothetical protein